MHSEIRYNFVGSVFVATKTEDVVALYVIFWFMGSLDLLSFFFVYLFAGTHPRSNQAPQELDPKLLSTVEITFKHDLN